MSEIRQITSIRSVASQPAREPLFTAFDVFRGLFGAAAFVARGTSAVVGAVHREYHQAHAAAEAHATARLRPVSPEALTAQVAAARTVPRALEAMGAAPLFISRARVAQVRAQVVALGNSDHPLSVAHVSRIAGLLAREHQQTLIANTVAIVRDACAEIGFDRLTVRPSDGYVLAQRSGAVGGPTLRADIRVGEAGGVELHLDAARFCGTACRESLDRLEATLHAKGLEFDSMRVQPKRSPVLDGLRAPLGIKLV